MSCVKVIVSGIVQGVNYRFFCQQNANEMKIVGYAKNLYNGDVEVVAEGEDGLVKDFVKLLKVGPRTSRVTSVHVEEIECSNKYSGFSTY